MSKSSAYRRWWRAGVFLEICRPLMVPALSSLNMSLENTSNPRMKRKGDRGSPCLRLLVGEMIPNGLPFNKMEKEAEEMHALIQAIQVELKLFHDSQQKTTFHSIKGPFHVHF
jgi:hypothetical protein